jgi:hypothetical protein
MNATATSQGAGGVLRKWLIPLSIGIMVLLLILLSARTTRTPDTRPFELESAGPYGLRALRESLREMGYTVDDLRGQQFLLPDEGDLLLVWPGDELWTSDQVEALRDWVAPGRTAMVVASPYDVQRIFGDWGAHAYDGYPIGLTNEVHQSQPAAPSAPATLEGSDGTVSYDFAQRIVQVTEVGQSEWRATLGVEQVGDGWIWYNTDSHALNTANLRNPDQVAVLAAILRAVPDGGSIYFDAFHLYGPQTQNEQDESNLRTLQDWLYFTPLGQATLLAVAVGVLGWVLAGRRLGPPLKAERELKRREGAEYVRAMAGLKRRSHAHDEIAQRQAQRMKLALGKSRRIDATLDDAQFLAALRASGDMEAEQVQEAEGLLQRLRDAKSEEELIKAASAIDQFLARKSA